LTALQTYIYRLLSRACFQIVGENSKPCVELGYRCVELIEQATVTSPVITVKLELCRAIRLVNNIDESNANKLMGRRLRSKEAEGFSIQNRLDALKTLERIIIMCGRIDDSGLLEEICIAIWNTAVPLLQSHLRLQVHNALRLAASSLESLCSPLTRLRAQLHLELAKCEELSDFVAAAKEEANKAVACDYGTIDDTLVNKKFGYVVGDGIELDRDRNLDHIIKPLQNAFSIRSSVYDSPADIEGKVLLILQQVKESSSLKFQNEMLLKATAAMIKSIAAIDPVILKPDNTSEAAPVAATAPPPATEENASLTFREAELKTLSQLSVGELSPVVDDVPPEDLETVVTQPRVQAPPSPEALKAAAKPPAKGAAPAPVVPETPSVKFTPFSRLTQQRVQIMTTIAKMSHARSNILPLQQAARFVLGLVFNSEDPFCRELIEAQIEVYYLLAECLVFKLGKPGKKKLGGTMATTTTLTSAGFGGLAPEVDVEIDSRALGLETDDLIHLKMKKLVVNSLFYGLKLSQIMKDQYGVQNAIIYFWNLHIHVSRKNLYNQAIPELLTFLQAAMEAIEATAGPKPGGGKDAKDTGAATSKSSTTVAIPGYKPITQLDERLRISIISMYSALLAAKGEFGSGCDAAMKACVGSGLSIGEIYSRRRLVEQAGLYQILAANGGSGANAKGGKGGGGKAADGLKLDQPILSVFGLLAQGETPADGNIAGIPVEQYRSTCEKVHQLMEGEVNKYLGTLNIQSLTQESYDQIVEMQAEIWTRITRLKILQG
jgi:hypothetical protein